jgi:hypothetical protein
MVWARFVADDLSLSTEDGSLKTVFDDLLRKMLRKEPGPTTANPH